MRKEYETDYYFLKDKSNIDGLTYIPNFEDPNGFKNHQDDCPDVYTNGRPPLEISDCNLQAIDSILLGRTINNIVEIGVGRNETRSFIHKLLQYKTKNGIYCGIDVEDKSYLNDLEKNVFTLKETSMKQIAVRKYFNQIGLHEIDVLLIDGNHSVDTVVNDFKYSDLLSKKGIIIFHDTNYHPGPNIILDAIDKEKYLVIEYCTQDDDFGLSAAFKV